MRKSIIVLSILAFTFVSFAQEAQKSPEAIVQDYFSLLQKKKWLDITKLFSPSALDQFKQMVLPVIAIDLKQKNGELTNVFFGKKLTLPEINAMNNDDFFFFVMSAIMLQVSGTEMKFDKIEILGSVKEGDNMVHVVGRLFIGFGESQFSDVIITSLEKVNGEWRLMLTGDVQNLVDELKRMVMGG